MTARLSFKLLAAAVLAIACGGGSSDKSPTSPQQASILLDGVILLGTPDLDQAVLREVHLLLDGEVGFRQSHSPPSSTSSFQFYDAPISRGAHTLAVRVVSQSVSTQMYDLTGLLILRARGAQKDIMIPTTKKQLRAGESIEFKFDATL